MFLAQHIFDDLVADRRHLHANPELSFQEHGTAAYIKARLAAYGITQVHELAETGVVALIEGDKPGPTLAFRGDIDALPILEDNPNDYCSVNPGVMHACGHDVHATLGLGVAREIARRRDELCGRVKFIFQPAEEASPQDVPIGAERMVAEGVLQSPDVDAIFAFHCMPTLEVGKIGYTGGPVWARSDLIEIDVVGAKTHAAYPHSGVDAVVIASQLVLAMQTIPARRVDARLPCVLSIGKLEAGESYNIIAETAQLTGILRTLSDEAAEVATRELYKTAEGIAAAFGARINVKITPGARLTANDPGLEAKVVASMRQLVGDDVLVPHQPQMGAEDFAAFSRRVPACYMFLGVRNEARGIVHMIHTPKFDVDEQCLDLGVAAMSGAILDLAKNW